MINFIIIGCQKSGTSMLASNLRSIKDINIPNKELHFFNNYYKKGVEWYESNFISNNTCIKGEKTPNYILNPETLDRIKKYNPLVKIIIIFRNPILRAMSHWNHFNQEKDKKKNNWIYKDTFDESIKVNPSILTNGLYYEQLLEVYKRFDKKNVLILINEQFRDNSIKEFSKILTFINSQYSLDVIRNVHVRDYSNNRIQIKTITTMCHYYKDNIDNLCNILGYRIKSWDMFLDTYLHTNSIHPYTNSIRPYINHNVDNYVHDVTCIIICVNYSDFLKVTLPINKTIIKNILIVTTPNDKDTIHICKQNNINYITTNIFYDTNNSNIMDTIPHMTCDINNIQLYKKEIFNKSKAINYVLRLIKTDWALLIDADIILNKRLYNINIQKLNIDTLYGAHRIIYKNQEDWEDKKGYYDRWVFMGFFQLFNITSKRFVKDYYGYNDNYNFADKGDYYFSKKWKQKSILPYPVCHLGETCENWYGRISNKWGNTTKFIEKSPIVTINMHYILIIVWIIISISISMLIIN